MSRITVFLLLLLTTIFSPTYSQIADNFSDGNLTENPTWFGTIDAFIINEEKQLQLNAPKEAGQSQLVINSEIISDAEWSFYTKLEFNPSSNNFIDIYLVSDQLDLQEQLNGYFVRIGNTADEVSLYRQTGAISSAVKIIDGIDDRVDQSLVEMNIKVTRSGTGQWELLVDSELTQDFISEGIVNDNTFYHSKFFGIVCNYTATRSDRFYIDDIHISGQVHVDNTVPKVDSLAVVSDSSLHLYFSEKLFPSSATNIDLYFVNNDIGSPTAATLITKSSILLSFNEKFQDALINRISIHGVSDLFGNMLENVVFEFSYDAPYVIGFGDVIITEIMADPTPGIDLPEYEYLEIYNPNAKSLSLDRVKLIVGRDTTFIPDLLIESQEYLILCQHAAMDLLNPYGRTVKITNWPSLNNRGEVITLLNINNEVVQSIAYNDSWYRSIDKDDGGYSLEMIDAKRYCFGEINWIASTDPDGGTPGRENASKDDIIDITPPEIDNIVASSNNTITVHLSEGIGSQSLSSDIISFSPEIEAKSIELLEPSFIDLNVEFNTSLKAQTVYELTLKNLSDCAGNIQKGFLSTFVLPESADSLDLIINEILFNPRPGGVDFVEIYNQSEKFIDLSTISLDTDPLKPITTDHFILKPKQFLAITESTPTLQNQYPGIDMQNVIYSMNVPAFNNDEGNVFLFDAEGKYIDFFYYKDDYHSNFLNDTEGVSLERISYESPSNNANNWQSASSSAGYATPGQVNSQVLHSATGESEIVIDPKVFIPGDNAFNSFAIIKCRFSNTGNIASIYILDPKGRKIKTILSHSSIGVQDHFKWEGLDDNGQQVRMGPYIVHVEVYNLTGIKKLYRKKVVVGGKL